MATDRDVYLAHWISPEQAEELFLGRIGEVIEVVAAGPVQIISCIPDGLGTYTMAARRVAVLLDGPCAGGVFLRPLDPARPALVPQPDDYLAVYEPVEGEIGLYAFDHVAPAEDHGIRKRA